MSEKRKPDAKIVASISGKKTTVEIFHASQWPGKFTWAESDRFRVRVNGRWAQGNHAFTITEVLRQLRGTVARQVKKARRQKRICND